MRELLQPVKRFFLQVLMLLACYFISRCVFLILNHDHFQNLGVIGFLRIALAAMRFDLSVILTINIPFVLFLFLPVRGHAWDRILQFLFLTLNAMALALDLIDWVYFSFTLKRATIDIFYMMQRQGDFWSLLPHFLVDYWYIPVSLALLVLLVRSVNRRIVKLTPLSIAPDNSRQGVAKRLVAVFVLAGLMVTGIRGGFQETILNNNSAVQVASNQFIPLVLNTPFSIMHSFFNDRLPELHYYSEDELRHYLEPVKHYGGKTFDRKNVVVIILESFSKQFTGFGNRKSYTPFLDSLAAHGRACRNGYANALHSAEGVPAVIAGIPSLMNEPFTTSVYGTNLTTTLPGLLKMEGYSTAFYHGGTNGTMSFDLFSAGAGFKEYFGRDEYDNENDYDGNWGIWDEEFLQFFGAGLTKMKEPFFASILTLTSHDPFIVPERYKGKLPTGRLPVQQCIAYTDMALRKFFHAIAKTDWFNRTLFVITADHCALMTEDESDHTTMGFYQIPILFYAPGDPALAGSNHELAQQIDILPSVLDYLGYDKSFFAFGNSIFRKAKNRIVINDLNGHSKWIMNSCLAKAYNREITEVYNIATDSLCSRNIFGTPEDTLSEVAIPYYRAFLQTYHHALVRNAMKAP